MSRSGYSDEMDSNWSYICWRGAVASSIKGKRGQLLLKDLAEAMDAMPEKRLITDELKDETGHCALGVVGAKRGINLEAIDPHDAEIVASEFDIAEPLAKEIVYLNDEECAHKSPEERWQYMRNWVQENIKVVNESLAEKRN